MGTQTVSRRVASLLAIVLAFASISFLAAGKAGAESSNAGQVSVSAPIEPSSFDGDLSQAPISGPSGRAPTEGRVPGAQRDAGSGAESGEGSARTPGDAGDASVSAPIKSFPGVRNTAVAPPDPTGEIGPNHFVEAINSRFQIFDRDGTSLAGPSNINTGLWTGAGGLCEANNDGDPIVMYDQLADRWIIAQFAVPNPFAMCIAVSKTADPVSGGWWLYEAPMPAFPDYEKFGIWRDGLYMTTFEGALLGAFVFDYQAMKAGLAASFQRFTTASVDQTRGTRLLPADTEGEAFGPVGAPNVMLQTVDAQLTSAPADVDRIELFEFDADFTTPANSTFAKVADLPTAPFDNSMCYDTAPSPFRDCIPQSGSADGLDPLTNRPMWRASYRVFGDHQSIVFNQTVDENGLNHAGIRWYELRKPLSGGNWSIFQQGTFSPDTTHRWMGSAAINRLHEIGLGYSASSSSIFPSLRYAGRVGSDPPGQLGAEQTLVNGGEFHAGPANRWGDYSQMSIDPLDDCTMWYVGEFGDRRTQIGSFRVSDCVPDTSISGPSATKDKTPTFELVADEPDATLQCALDGAALAGCPASFTTPSLGDGSHTLAARAVGVKGAVDPSPASFEFEVDTKVSKPKVKAKKKQKQKGKKIVLKAKAGAAEDVEVKASGTVKVGKKKFKLKKSSKSAKAGKKASLKLKPASKSVAKKLAKALGSGKAQLVFKFTDDVGNKAKIKKSVKIK